MPKPQQLFLQMLFPNLELELTFELQEFVHFLIQLNTHLTSAVHVLHSHETAQLYSMLVLMGLLIFIFRLLVEIFHNLSFHAQPFSMLNHALIILLSAQCVLYHHLLVMHILLISTLIVVVRLFWMLSHTLTLVCRWTCTSPWFDGARVVRLWRVGQRRLERRLGFNNRNDIILIE